MTKDIPLYDKIYEQEYPSIPILWASHVKEAVHNAERRLKNYIKDTDIFLLEKIDEIFKEEFGGGLTQ